LISAATLETSVPLKLGGDFMTGDNMPTFTADKLLGDLIEDTKVASLSQEARELVISAAVLARYEMHDQVSRAMNHEFMTDDGTTKSMLRYAITVMVWINVTALTNDRVFTPMALEAKAWLNTWSESNH
jgi:hypothetical protein